MANDDRSAADGSGETGFDGIVIGSGHNGLVSAACLARAGWRMLVLERNAGIGGAVQSGEITAPGFTHDLWSMNQNLFRSSPAYAALQQDLERHGLSYCISQHPFCNLFPDGRSLRIHSDIQRTRALLREHDRRDAHGFDRLHERYRAFSRHLLPLLSTPMPSPQAGAVLARATAARGIDDMLEWSRLLLGSTRELGEQFFVTEEMRALVAAWGMHLDFGPDVSGGAQFPLLEIFGSLENGIAIARGGASAMPRALAGIVREHGGEVRTQASVRRILVEQGTASGVELESGERIPARRQVIANLGPGPLFDGLLADVDLKVDFRRKVAGFSYGPATLMLHLALRGRPRWAAGDEIADFAYVHIAPYVDDLARTYSQSLAGMLPDSPLLIVGQPSAFDHSRAPEGDSALWIQVRTVPAIIRGDAAGVIEARDWDQAGISFADRVMTKLERYAPGISGQVIDRRIYTPSDLERNNPNLVGGDSTGGSHHLRQNFLLRPFPGWSTYHTPIERLAMVGASTWPGAGTNAGSGWMLAQDLLHGGSLRKWMFGGAALGGVMAVARRMARAMR